MISLLLNFHYKCSIAQNYQNKTEKLYLRFMNLIQLKNILILSQIFCYTKDFRQAIQTHFINYDGKLFNSRTILPSEKSLKPYLVEKSGIVQLVQRRPVSRLDAHDIPVIVQSGQGLPGHVPEGLLGLLLAKETGPTFKTVDPIHVKSGSPRIQLHYLRVGIATVYSVFVCHIFINFVFFACSCTASFPSDVIEKRTAFQRPD